MGQQGQQGSGDNALAPIWYASVTIIGAWLLWYYYHTIIVKYLLWLSYWQLKVIYLVYKDEILFQQIYITETIDPASLDFNQALAVLAMAGHYTRYFLFVISLFFMSFLLGNNIKLKYNKAHDMRTLRAKEQNNWTAIMPVIKEDLASIDINIGPWSMALTPMEFCRKHKLLKKNEEILDNQIPGMERTAGFRRSDAKRVFTLQLGQYFTSFEQVPKWYMALAAVFMARINRDQASGRMIIDVLNKTWAAGKPDYDVARPTFKKYYDTPIVQRVLASHSYMLTVMASLLVEARSDGVVPCAEFLWLKITDRRLWYMLNSMGRQTPYSEVGGPFAHWKAERKLGRPSLVPMVDEAIKAVAGAVKEVKLSLEELKELKL